MHRLVIWASCAWGLLASGTAALASSPSSESEPAEVCVAVGVDRPGTMRLLGDLHRRVRGQVHVYANGVPLGVVGNNRRVCGQFTPGTYTIRLRGALSWEYCDPTYLPGHAGGQCTRFDWTEVEADRSWSRQVTVQDGGEAGLLLAIDEERVALVDVRAGRARQFRRARVQAPEPGIRVPAVDADRVAPDGPSAAAWTLAAEVRGARGDAAPPELSEALAVARCVDAGVLSDELRALAPLLGSGRLDAELVQAGHLCAAPPDRELEVWRERVQRASAEPDPLRRAALFVEPSEGTLNAASSLVHLDGLPLDGLEMAAVLELCERSDVVVDQVVEALRSNGGPDAFARVEAAGLRCEVESPSFLPPSGPEPHPRLARALVDAVADTPVSADARAAFSALDEEAMGLLDPQPGERLVELCLRHGADLGAMTDAVGMHRGPIESRFAAAGLTCGVEVEEPGSDERPAPESAPPQ